MQQERSLNHATDLTVSPASTKRFLRYQEIGKTPHGGSSPCNYG